MRDLVVAYGQAVAVDRVSLELRRGERVALIGPNGAGKTSLLNAVCGLLRPVGGQVRIDGHEVTGASPSEMVALGVTQAPEGRQVFPSLPVEANLMLGALGPSLGGGVVAGMARYLRGRTAIRAQLEHVYELLPKLRELRQRPAGRLSGGEQQMVAIGRALMARPRLLAIDELSLGLAPVVVADLASSLADLNEREGVTLLLIEQNAQLALDLCERAYVVESGRCVREDASRELQTDETVRAAYLGGGLKTSAR